MENFLRFKEYWGVVENRVPAATDGAILTDAQNLRRAEAERSQS